MEEKIYFYDYKYWTLEEISEMYRKLNNDKKKLFKDAIAHYTLADILNKCNYDRRIIHTIWEIAGNEVDRMDLIGSDCGRPMLAYNGLYKRFLRKLLNLTGKLAINDDPRMNRFANGEWYLNNLVCLTIGSSFEKDIIDDLFLIDSNSLSKEECLAIADNFIRDLNGEKIVFYNESKQYKK